MKIARTLLAIVLLSWAGWELLQYFYLEPRREEAAKECRDSGRVVIPGDRGIICAPKK